LTARNVKAYDEYSWLFFEKLKGGKSLPDFLTLGIQSELIKALRVNGIAESTHPSKEKRLKIIPFGKIMGNRKKRDVKK
jgi:hypothetical protein